MDQDPYIPDLDDADFRRLIDARVRVLIKFWSGQAHTQGVDETFFEAVRRHPEVAFAQSNVDEHQNLMLRAQAHDIPVIQGWVGGSLFGSIPGQSSGQEIDAFIANMDAHLADRR